MILGYTWFININTVTASRILLLLFTNSTCIKYTALDVLVNSAGILVGGATADLSLEDYERCMAINTTAAFVLTREVIPHLIATKGNIVHVSSVTGEVTLEPTFAFWEFGLGFPIQSSISI